MRKGEEEKGGEGRRKGKEEKGKRMREENGEGEGGGGRGRKGWGGTGAGGWRLIGPSELAAVRHARILASEEKGEEIRRVRAARDKGGALVHCTGGGKRAG